MFDLLDIAAYIGTGLLILPLVSIVVVVVWMSAAFNIAMIGVALPPYRDASPFAIIQAAVAAVVLTTVLFAFLAALGFVASSLYAYPNLCDSKTCLQTIMSKIST